MTPDDISVVRQFVDNALEKLHQIDLMRLPDSNMPLEMRDEAGVAQDDWLPWKAIPSTVTDSDIKELESRINRRYPDLYKEFLCYKHFYELWPVKDIEFFRHTIHGWKTTLLDRYFKSWDPTKLIEQGYVYFADYSDWGMICFDTNNQSQHDNDCPIIMIDHELLFDDPVPTQALYSSFTQMMRSLLAEQENPVQPEE